jgi:hypothetical protein
MRKKTRIEAESVITSAAAFDRKISTSQYHSSGTNFLQDLVFVLSHPSEQRGRFNYGADDGMKLQIYDERLREVHKNDNYVSVNSSSWDSTPPLDANKPGTISSLGPKAEFGQHSMHVTRLSNPSLTNPIAWKIFCSRNDALTCTPLRECWLPAKQSTFISRSDLSDR